MRPPRPKTRHPQRPRNKPVIAERAPNIDCHPERAPNIDCHPERAPNIDCHPERAPNIDCHPERAPNIDCHPERAPNIDCHPERAQRVEGPAVVLPAPRPSGSVPHPSAFFLAEGWETSTLNQPVHQERPLRAESNAKFSSPILQIIRPQTRTIILCTISTQSNTPPGVEDVPGPYLPNPSPPLLNLATFRR